MLVLVAPGQGAQTPGFLRPWLELDGVEERLHWWSAVCGLDLVHYGTEADAETIRDTAIAQPLLVAAGLIGLLALFPHPGDGFAVVGAAAGHSVGEITAAAGTGVITAESAMVLVRERGRAMARAAEATPTGMTAILGGDRESVLARLAELGLIPANDNGAGQVVAAGDLKALAQLAEQPPADPDGTVRARLRPLSVAGAFHTDYMAPAVDTLASLVSGVTVRDPRTRYISNADGAVVHEGRQVLRRIVDQVASPVRWDRCMATMAELGVTALIEMPPAGTLTGLARRGLPGVKTLALKTPDDLDAARAVVAEHGTANPLEAAPAWRLVVAPSSGTVRRGAPTAGERLASGTHVADIASPRDSVPVVSRHGGTVIEWLVEDGDPVAPGQPLLRLHPRGGEFPQAEHV